LGRMRTTKVATRLHRVMLTVVEVATPLLLEEDIRVPLVTLLPPLPKRLSLLFHQRKKRVTFLSVALSFSFLYFLPPF